MKKIFLFAAACAAIFMSACAEDILRSEYRLEMPDLPESWHSLFGPAHWRVEWVNDNGELVIAETDGAFYADAAILQGKTTPVLAYPYWPGVTHAGAFRPAGALSPLDVEGGSIRLSWNAGVEAAFYLELAKKAATSGNLARSPEKFNWTGFRALFNEKKPPSAVCDDPWLVDWEDVAEKTAASGFSVRKIVECEYENLSITVPADGPWVGNSPFAQSMNWKEDAKAVLRVTSAVDSYYCTQGVLRCKKDIAVYEPYARESLRGSYRMGERQGDLTSNRKSGTIWE
jgi:hypothetical protein